MDPELYLAFGKLLLDAVEMIPRDGMSEETRLKFAQKVETAKIMLEAKSPEEKHAAMELMGKVTDASVSK